MPTLSRSAKKARGGFPDVATAELICESLTGTSVSTSRSFLGFAHKPRCGAQEFTTSFPFFFPPFFHFVLVPGLASFLSRTLVVVRKRPAHYFSARPRPPSSTPKAPPFPAPGFPLFPFFRAEVLFAGTSRPVHFEIYEAS